MKTLKNYIAIITIAALMFAQSAPAVVWAEEASPETTPIPSGAPINDNVAPTSQPVPTAPAQDNNVTPTPTVAVTPSQEVTTTPTPTAVPTLTPEEQKKEDAKQAAAAAWWAEYNKNQEKSGPTANGGVGETVIVTGDGLNQSSIATDANTNAIIQPTATSGAIVPDSTSGAVIVNDDNGAGSNNAGNSVSIVDNTTNQNNGAVVSNNINQSTNTGNSQASFNVGDTVIKTGNANTTATAITNVNTNIDGLMVSEFNIVDDQMGDLILTPEVLLANCISGCGATSGTVANTNNGTNATNNEAVNTTANNTTNQTNNAVIGNSMDLIADSGNNDASFNTGGDTVIYTGDANISANALTLANNNIEGGITFTTVNVYGNWSGDIIVPGFESGAVGSDATLANTGNGANATSNTAHNSDITNTTNQTNDANIVNDLIVNANTGDNSAAYGTDGTGTIKTGDTNVNAQVLNIANTNVEEEDMWIVLINNAGNWIGQLLGEPLGAMMASSNGAQFMQGPDGQTTVSNGGNGAGSNNDAATNSTVNNTTNQANTADIHNTMNLTANTGGNTANYNTGGNNTIVTGDANVMANFINVVNTNIAKGRRLLVTIVNIFPTALWNGDFVPAGQQKRDKTQDITVARGGVSETISVTPTPTIVSAVTEETKTVTVTPTPTIVRTVTEETVSEASSTTGHTKAFKKKKVAVATQGGAAASYNGNQIAVAGASTEVGGNDSLIKQLIGAESKKVINFNLAYIILLAPVLMTVIIARKLILRRLLMKKN